MNGIFIVYGVDSSVDVELKIQYNSMMSSGRLNPRNVTIPDPNKVDHVFGIISTLREFKTTRDLWGTALSVLGISNNFESTFSIDNDLTVYDMHSLYESTEYRGFIFFIDPMMY